MWRKCGADAMHVAVDYITLTTAKPLAKSSRGA